MRRLLICLILALAMLLPNVALADPLIPPRPNGAPPYGEAPPLYDDPRFEPWAYTFEGFGQTNSLGLVSIYFWLNQLLVAKAWLLKVAIRMTEYAHALSFFDPFATGAADALSALGDSFWSTDGAPLVSGALSLAALSAILLYLRGRLSRVWASLGGTVLVLMLTTVVLSAGDLAVSTVTGLSRELALQVFHSVDAWTQPGYTDRGLTVRSGDNAWRTLVYEPWADGEFGSEEGKARYGEPDDAGFLAKMPEDRRLLCGFVGSEDLCPWWKTDFLPRRMMLAVATFLTAAVYSGALIALAGGMIFAQMAMLFMLALAPVWLLVAIWWPEGGLRLVRRILVKVWALMIGQVMFSATLAVLLVLTELVRAVFPGAGWMMHAMLLAALGVLAFRYRYAWLEPFNAAITHRERFTGVLLDRLRVRRSHSRTLETVREAWPTPADAAVVMPGHAVPAPVAAMARQATPDERYVGHEGEHSVEFIPEVSPRERFQVQMSELREHWNVRHETIARGLARAEEVPVALSPAVQALQRRPGPERRAQGGRGLRSGGDRLPADRRDRT